MTFLWWSLCLGLANGIVVVICHLRIVPVKEFVGLWLVVYVSVKGRATRIRPASIWWVLEGCEISSFSPLKISDLIVFQNYAAMSTIITGFPNGGEEYSHPSGDGTIATVEIVVFPLIYSGLGVGRGNVLAEYIGHGITEGGVGLSSCFSVYAHP